MQHGPESSLANYYDNIDELSSQFGSLELEKEAGNNNLLSICEGIRPEFSDFALETLKLVLNKLGTPLNDPHIDIKVVICYVAELLNQQADINCRDPLNGETPLIKASKSGLILLVDLLYSYGADGSLQSTDGVDFFKALHDSTQIEEIILQKRHLVCNSTKDILSLYFALHNPVKITTLLKEGTKVNATSFLGDTALHFAVASGAPLQTLAILLQNGADFTLKNMRNETAFELARRVDERDDIIGLLQVKNTKLAAKSIKHARKAKFQFLLGMYDEHCRFKQPTTDLPMDLCQQILGNISHDDFVDLAKNDLIGDHLRLSK